MQLILLGCLVSFAISVALTPAVIRAATARGLVDWPDEDRRRHARAVPRIGGIAILTALTCGLLVSSLFFSWLPGLSDPTQQHTLRLTLGAGLAVFAIGIWDDLFGMAPRVKLALTVLVAAALYAFGFRIEHVGFPYSRAVPLGLLAFPVTVLWVTVMTHAMNLIDGLDGLASGIAIVALAAAGVAAGLLGQPGALLVAAVLGSAMVGFLIYNRHPARVFLGDCGSLSLGAMLAVITVRAAEAESNTVFFLLPLLALAYPVLDTSLSIMRRWLRGVSFSVADRRHIHHQLLALGPSYGWAVGTLYICATALATLGILLAFAPRSLVAVIALVGGSLFAVTIVIAVRWLGYHELLEAASSVLSVFRNARHVIRDKIFARDVCEMLEEAHSLADIRQTLSQSAAEFGFLHIQLYREMDAGAPAEPLPLDAEQKGHAWRLEYPILPWPESASDSFVLRIWCDMQAGSRPYGAERAARLIAPTVQARVRALALPSSESRTGAADDIAMPVGERRLRRRRSGAVSLSLVQPIDGTSALVEQAD